jgi:S1-C subfamily serine protease
MANKVIIGILVLLVVLTGGIGYYSYTLNQQIEDLGERLTSFQAEQVSQINAMSEELGDLQQEASYLGNRIEAVRSEVDILGNELETASGRISGVEEEIAGVSTQVGNLDERIGSAETDISRSLIDANEVYESVSRATVRITNGQNTLGSGFIYDTEGHVVTANHVIEGLTEIFVMLYDGRVSKAVTIGSCQTSDVAVLKLEDSPSIEPLTIGDSSLVRIGEPVIAIGSPGDGDDPLGLRDTLTSGIISQVNRFVHVEDSYVSNMLQFDAAVNFGNSGCPLVNASSEVIGLVTARIDPTIGDGIYWAVASNKVKRVADAIIESGSFGYPWIGVGLTDLTPQVVQGRSLETANGVLVTAVYPGSPAAAAGIQADDIIVVFDGVSVRDTGELTSYLGERKSPGDKVVFEVLRGADRLEIPMEIGEREE